MRSRASEDRQLQSKTVHRSRQHLIEAQQVGSSSLLLFSRPSLRLSRLERQHALMQL
jgi:hypothetical protein